MKDWYITPHALERGANRFGLIIDRKAELEISRILDSPEAVCIVRDSHGAALYEFSMFGKKVIAACDVTSRSVITFMDSKRWHREQFQKVKYRRWGKSENYEEERNEPGD